MAVYKRSDTGIMLKGVEQGKACNIYLIVGERYLCRKVADKLISVLVPDLVHREQSVVKVDGEQENPAKTLASLKTYGLFSGKQVVQVSGTRLFHSKAVAKNIWERAEKAFSQEKIQRSLVNVQQFADIGNCTIEDLFELSPTNWKTTFSFPKPQDLSWLKEVNSHNTEISPQEKSDRTDPAELYMSAFEAGIPPDNTLILLAETVDKRKKFYKYIAKHGGVADLSVASGTSKAARTDQESLLKSLVNKTLSEFGKKIEPQAVVELIERVGFHPVAVVRETEKLALHAGDSQLITSASLREIVGRTREDALFELTEAYVDKKLEATLTITQRLFNDGTHPLVLVSGLRNHLKKLLLVRSIREAEEPAYVSNMSYGSFQKGYLPELKKEKEEWLGQLPNHPYALFMMFEKVSQYSIKSLVEKLEALLKVEHLLKSSRVPPQILFERFLYGIA